MKRLVNIQSLDADVRTSPLRVKSNFLKRFNLIWVVQSLRKKYFALSRPQITSIFRASRLTEGRLAIVTNARRDAVDASGASDEGASLADGEVVWS